MLREVSGIKQVDAAAKLNIAQSTISMWERGSNLPQAELLPKIAALYNCTVDELLANEAPNKKASPG